MERHQIFTIGHSTLSLDAFLSALRANGVSAVADVRSAPYSRFNPAFNRDPLKRELKACGMRYVFLGKELGGRPTDPAGYENGRASYSRMSQTDVFRAGLDRVIQGSMSHRIALMCSEGQLSPVRFTPQLVESDNHAQVGHSRRFVFCDRDEFDFARSFCAAHPELRDEGRERFQQ